VTDILAVILGATMLYVYATSRIEGYLKILALQGALLFVIVLVDFASRSPFETVFLGAEALGLKAVAIPAILFNLVRKNEVRREIEPSLPQFFSLILASLIFVFGFVIAFWARQLAVGLETLAFGISISIIVSGLLLVMSRKKIVTHIIGYIFMENGIFLLSLSVAGEMPFIVNLGVLLDVFVAVYLFVVFSNRIQRAYDEDHIDALQNLKE
jgi:hydrogenase-4 component E